MAKEILTLDAVISDGVITVNGAAEDGMLAAAIVIYNADGTQMLFAESTSVAADGSFAYTLDTGARGTYIVSVADYEGNATAKVVTVSESTAAEASVGSPKTGFETQPAAASPAPEANASAISGALFFVGFLALAAAGFFAARLVMRRRARSRREA
ncbi:hypothetical protein IJJ18_03375 [Candidatus Saccharibacteria bacterium]|nr:hypothetical protein [Candidatus Saccharibacteria bacterium]